MAAQAALFSSSIIDVNVNTTRSIPWTSRARSSSSPAAHPASAKARRACWPPGRQGRHRRHAGRQGRSRRREIGGAFVKCDVSQEADGQAVVAKAVSMGKLMGLVNCAGIAPAEKTVGKNGAHNLGVFTKTIMVNLVGSFNMIRLAADAMARTSPSPPASAAA
jgi:NAD(P)-dependent dehydrogenase (short-subunit alcohol dehydrogenase family)